MTRTCPLTRGPLTRGPFTRGPFTRGPFATARCTPRCTPRVEGESPTDWTPTEEAPCVAVPPRLPVC
jgi:hypothetical protein